ncbi:MAG: hypothetical protein ACFFDW_04580 [Candidatus Thorarchaeota archaeon]
MKTTSVSKFAVIVSLLVISMSFSPILFARGETYTLINEHFYIAPQRPEVLADNYFNLTETNEYVIGIPESEAIGTRTDSSTYYFEMWSTGRVEIYFLNSPDYLAFSNAWDGTPPSTYAHRIVCDGYINEEFSLGGSIQPKLILYSNNTEVTGNYFWSEGLDHVIYTPYYLRSIGSDKPTNDFIHIFNVNASVDLYIMDDEQYDSWSLSPNDAPSSLERTEFEIGTNIEVNFTAAADSNIHILIWHTLLHDSVNGSLYWTYSYQRTFAENYWSLFVVVILIVLFVLTAVFQKQVLPPIVWTLTKTKYYLISFPWKYIKKGFKYIGHGFAVLWRRLRRIPEEEMDEAIEGKKTDKEIEE